jgi:hypothetical protein
LGQSEGQDELSPFWVNQKTKLICSFLGQSEDQAERFSYPHLHFFVIILGCSSSYGYFLIIILFHPIYSNLPVDEHLPLRVFFNRKLWDSSLPYSYVLAALAY